MPCPPLDSRARMALGKTPSREEVRARHEAEALRRGLSLEAYHAWLEAEAARFDAEAAADPSTDYI